MHRLGHNERVKLKKLELLSSLKYKLNIFMHIEKNYDGVASMSATQSVVQRLEKLEKCLFVFGLKFPEFQLY